MKPHGPWTIKSTRDVYQDSFVRVWLDDVVRPDGDDGQHVVVAMKPGVCVLAIDDELNVHLTDEFHYGVGRNLLEGVSGGIEPGEEPAETARRELQEELGLIAKDWEHITTIDPFTTIVVSPTRLYFATGLTPVAANQEGTETIQARKLPLAECFAQVQAGVITHGPTCVLILLAQIRFGSNGSAQTRKPPDSINDRMT